MMKMLVVFISFLILSLNAYSSNYYLVSKGCYNNLNETFDLKKYVSVTQVDKVFNSFIDDYSFEVWDVHVSDSDKLSEIESVGVECGYIDGFIYRGTEAFLNGFPLMRAHTTPSDLIIKYDLKEDIYYVFLVKK